MWHEFVQNRERVRCFQLGFPLLSAGPYCGAARRLNETTHLVFEVKGFSLTTDLRFQKNVPSLCGFSF